MSEKFEFKALASAMAADGENPYQGDLFVCNIANWPIKDDIASMEIPLFSLSKNKDLETREYRRGNKTIRVIPPSVGAATVFDKDLLIYVASQIVEALNQGRPVSRTVQVDSYDFILSTARSDGSASFDRIVDMLRRLRGTTIETNIETGGVRQLEGFSLIESYKVIETTKNKKGAIRFTVTVSEWLYNGLLKYEVLTLDPAYFRLSKSIEKRLYEIARKHCGDQTMWKINIDLLAEKVGTSRPRRQFRSELRDVIKTDALPEYRLALDHATDPDTVVFYTRNSAKLAKQLMATPEQAVWFCGLEKGSTHETEKLAR
ncbi:replication initiator protein A [Chromobacterium phragmitis]|uniref:replication initiator protein A n=1 Tax=Chromobacterium amazonense TaxID=1382803 RepID=UPI0021B75F48|nr:replication initiator protein A [Chromobacterium amazonense]MBM2886499.1 replication initiator protein A [Chromobacterium amazonense]